MNQLREVSILINTTIGANAMWLLRDVSAHLTHLGKQEAVSVEAIRLLAKYLDAATDSMVENQVRVPE